MRKQLPATPRPKQGQGTQRPPTGVPEVATGTDPSNAPAMPPGQRQRPGATPPWAKKGRRAHSSVPPPGAQAAPAPRPTARAGGSVAALGAYAGTGGQSPPRPPSAAATVPRPSQMLPQRVQKRKAEAQEARAPAALPTTKGHHESQIYCTCCRRWVWQEQGFTHCKCGAAFPTTPGTVLSQTRKVQKTNRGSGL